MASQAAPLFWTVKDACGAIGLSRSMLYTLMGRGDLQFTMFGTKRLISHADLAELAERIKRGEVQP